MLACRLSGRLSGCMLQFDAPERSLDGAVGLCRACPDLTSKTCHAAIGCVRLDDSNSGS